jgi:hypothetical protein
MGRGRSLWVRPYLRRPKPSKRTEQLDRKFIYSGLFIRVDRRNSGNIKKIKIDEPSRFIVLRISAGTRDSGRTGMPKKAAEIRCPKPQLEG